MQIEFVSSICDVPAADWQRLWPGDYPFIQHGFLRALETSGSVCAQTGWQPCHLMVKADQQWLAAMPLYEKTHSYGEYVFDWGWAEAYQHAGLNYYPKLLNAVPFTPATGPRVGFAPALSAAERERILALLLEAVGNRLDAVAGSGFHSLFPDAGLRAQWMARGLIERQGCQFHWFNDNYRSFDDFLLRFNSRKRKSLRRERQKVQAQDLRLQMRSAGSLSLQEWDVFYALYHRTYFKRSGRQGYLNREFFRQVVEAMPDQVLLASAHHETLDNEMLAGALYFRDGTTLYGRYWGTKIDVDGLHFETCYYQGIDYAIAHQLQRFDPGAQGEHKIQRGFTPVKTCSFHEIRHPGFREAVVDFCRQERDQTAAYCADGRTYLPFREGEPLVDENCLLGEL